MPVEQSQRKRVKRHIHSVIIVLCFIMMYLLLCMLLLEINYYYLSNLLKYGRTIEATLTQGQAMAGNNIGTRTKRAMTVGADASVFHTELHQHSTVPSPNGLFRVIAACQPIETPDGRIIIT